MNTAEDFYNAGFKYQDGVGRGGSGMRTGASSDAGLRLGDTHAFDTNTNKTVCGRTLKQRSYRINRSLPGSAPSRALTCSTCRARLGV